MMIQKTQVLLYLKLDPKKVDAPKELSQDKTGIGHHGTGDLQLSAKNQNDLELVKPLLEQAYRNVGG